MLVSLPLSFHYHPEAGSASICSPDAAVTDVFDDGHIQVTRQAIADFVHTVGWRAIINLKVIFPKAIDHDLLQLVYLSNNFPMLPGTQSLKRGDVVETRVQVNAVLNPASGRMVGICGTISRYGRLIMEVTSQLLCRGTCTDYENTFQRKIAGMALMFRLSISIRFQDEKIFSSVETLRQLLARLSTKECITGQGHINPIINYLERHGTSIKQHVNFDNAIPLNAKTERLTRALASNEEYGHISGDYNPIHVSRTLPSYANFARTITHGILLISGNQISS
ncbi:hypothetical protein HOY80DRAFT_1089119 [Tuber brumale]|nr:hypothetical protein HOY80DRAFT_1089119 [Tuber brumale]